MSAACFDRCLALTVVSTLCAGGVSILIVGYIKHLRRQSPTGTIIVYSVFTFFYIAVCCSLCYGFYSAVGLSPRLWLPSLCRCLSRQRAGQQQRNEPREMHALPREAPVTCGPRVATADDILAERHVQEDAQHGSAECRVCLGDIEQGEMVKWLPLCLHMFHKECIDEWLRAHSTCPVCRSNVLAQMPLEIV